MSPRKGQKISDDPIEKLVHFRANKETIKKLEIVSKTRKKTKSEVIRNGIDIQYENMKKGENNGENNISTKRNKIISNAGNKSDK